MPLLILGLAFGCVTTRVGAGDPLDTVAAVYIELEQRRQAIDPPPISARAPYLSSSLQARLVAHDQHCVAWRARVEALPVLVVDQKTGERRESSIDDAPPAPECEVDPITCVNGFIGNPSLALVSMGAGRAEAQVTAGDLVFGVSLVDESGWRIDRVACP